VSFEIPYFGQYTPSRENNVDSLHQWWATLSGESKAAIIAAVVSPVVAAILGLCMGLVRWFYILAIEKMDTAREQIHKEQASMIRTRLGGPIDDATPSPISTQRLAKAANVPLWFANRAIRWGRRAQRFGLK
jgi:hypothetical protein